MPLSRTYDLNGVSVSLWKVTEDEEVLCSLAGLDYAVERGRFSAASRRLEWLAVRALLMQVYGTNQVEYDADGRPSLVGVSGYISISHTLGYVAVAFSQSHDVGVDVELVTRRVGAVVRRFMRDEELFGIPCECVNNAKLLRWTASEALFKLVGDLGGNYRDNILVSNYPVAASGGFEMSIVGLPACEGLRFLADFLFTGELLVTVCRAA